MAAHEESCIRRRLGARTADLRVRNALADQADETWADRTDALILGGSGDHSVHDQRSRPWVLGLRRLLDAALERATPTFGICFGHQLLAHHLGGRVHTAPEQAEIGTVDLELTAAGCADPVFSELEPQFMAHTGHSDHVVETPAGVELLATGPALRTQAFKVSGLSVYTTQFHPDMTGAEAINRYLAYRRVLSPQDGEAVSRFRPGADGTSVLLGRFLDHATQGGAD